MQPPIPPSTNILDNIYARIGLVTMAVTAFVLLIVGYWLLIKRYPRGAVAIALVLALAGLIWLFESVLPARFPEVDPALPLFASHIWTWMLVFTLMAIAGGTALGWFFWRRRWGSRDTDAGGFADLDATWEAILLRLGQARIDPAAQRWFLLLTPDEAASEALIRAAGIPIFAQVPEGTTGPVRLFASAEGLFLSCGGACGLGMQTPEGPERLAYLARKLDRLDPDCPPVRGIVVVLPADWCSQGQAPQQAAAVRDDLHALRTTLKLRLPVFAVLPRAETLPGFIEFIARMPEAMRHGRCGFAIPSTVPFSAELMQRALGWLAGWFDTWCWNLMAGDVLNTSGNGRLYLLAAEVRRLRRRWRAVFEAAFSTHRDAEPVLLRGVYLTATGDGPDQMAFATGLLRAARGRILADHALTGWSGEAHQHDRRYRHRAWAVGLTGAALALSTWAFNIGRESWWIGGLILGVIAWVGVAVWISRR